MWKEIVERMRVTKFEEYERNMKDLSRFFSSSNHVKNTACIFLTPNLTTSHAFIPFSISLSLRFFSSSVLFSVVTRLPSRTEGSCLSVPAGREKADVWLYDLHGIFARGDRSGSLGVSWAGLGHSISRLRGEL